MGKFRDRVSRKSLRPALSQKLSELEQFSLPGVSISEVLLRYTIAVTLVHKMLPAGHTVVYAIAEADTIPTIPVPDAVSVKSAIYAQGDALLEGGLADADRCGLQVPYVEAARRFYFPQWVAFDDQSKLLIGSINEAEAHLASMQRYLFVLHAAVGLAPYMVADEQYQQKRYGVLGQLVNQGRQLARWQVGEIVKTIQCRVAAQDLNQGLYLSLSYFDDQKLSIERLDFDVIPGGRIMFVPAFVVRAAHEQQVKVAQDTRLSPATRRHLLTLLYLLGSAFFPPNGDVLKIDKG